MILNHRNFNKVQGYLKQYFCGVVSAYIGDDAKADEEATKDLTDKLKGLNLGYIELEGSYEYTDTLPKDTPQDKIDKLGGGAERSFLFFNKRTGLSDVEFVDLCVDFCIAYNQQTVLVGVPLNVEEGFIDSKGQQLKAGHGYWYKQSGAQVKDCGKFSAETVEQWQARRKAEKEDKTPNKDDQWQGDSEWGYDQERGSFAKGRSKFKGRKFGYTNANFKYIDGFDPRGLPPSSFRYYFGMGGVMRNDPERFWGSEAWQRIQQAKFDKYDPDQSEQINKIGTDFLKDKINAMEASKALKALGLSASKANSLVNRWREEKSWRAGDGNPQRDLPVRQSADQTRQDMMGSIAPRQPKKRKGPFDLQ